MAKSYRYKVYNGADYVGDFDNVISEFEYTNIINSAGAQLRIQIQKSFDDVNASREFDTLIDNNGDYLVDDLGNNLITDVSYSYTGLPINLGNRVTVFEYSDDNVNGAKVFEGIITTWKTNTDAQTMEVIVFSYGYELAQYIISEGEDLNIEQTEYDTGAFISPTSGKSIGQSHAQVFNLTVDAEIAGFSLWLKSEPYVIDFLGYNFTYYQEVSATLFQGTPGDFGEQYGTITRTITVNEFNEYKFDFGEPLSLTAGDYTIVLFHNYGVFYDTELEVAYDSAGPYASGNRWTTTGGSSPLNATWAEQTGEDLAFVINNSQGATTLGFTNVDAGAGVRNAMILYQQQGGRVQYDTSTIIDAGASLTYTFNLASVYDIVQKALNASPSSYFFYVDPADSTLYYKEQSLSADHTFIKGKHIQNLSLEHSIDELVNRVYFSGGDTTGNGDYLLATDKRSASELKYGRWSKQLADLRVTTTATAQQFMNTELGNNSEPKYTLECTISSADYDITTIKIGDMIKISNYGGLIDDLLLQVKELTYTPYAVNLTLGNIIPRTTNTIGNINNRLEALELANAPTAYS